MRGKTEQRHSESEDAHGKPLKATAFQVFLVGLLLRSLVSLHPYSGQGKPPMFGDYEAQRHFMEITYQLPTNQWYRYDLEYWGLDYPPLTAFHSAILGYFSHLIDPRWVELDKSRGWESYEHALFMRWSVLLADVLVYFSAVWAAVDWWIPSCMTNNSKEYGRLRLLTTLLAYPGFILIDHGHFQYNCVMLGFALWALVLIGRGWRLIGAVMFCLSIGYKQMALYYSLAFFSYLLGMVLFPVGGDGSIMKRIGLLIGLTCSVLGTFSALLFPFFRHEDGAGNGWAGVWQVLIRLFPFQRGLFEDKVGNFWCAISPLLRLRQWFTADSLAGLSTLITFTACLPACYLLLTSGRRIMSPQNRQWLFIYGTAQISLTFFLLSFQVHEKSILIPALPVLLLDAAPAGEQWFIEWFGYVSMFSMYPLVKKDGLYLAYLSLLLLWNYLLWLARGERAADRLQSPAIRWAEWLSYAGMLAVHLVDALASPPQRLPDLFTMMNVWLSAGCFLLANGYLLYRCFQLASPAAKTSFTVVKKHL